MIIYLIKLVICGSIFLTVYHLFLEKEKMHRFNRFYLLFSMLLSFIIPIISIDNPIPIKSEFIANEVIFNRIILNNTLARELHSSSHSQKDSGLNYTFLIYISVTAVLLIRLIHNFTTIINEIKGKNIIHYRGAKLVAMEDNLFFYSFWNYIFFNKQQLEQNTIRPEILRHELSHVKQKHSLDIIITEIILAVAWINPVIYFYKRAIVLNHEFLADDYVLKEFDNIHCYQSLLLDSIPSDNPCMLGSQFNYSSLKKRLLIMTRKSRPLVLLAKQISLLPLLLGCIVIFSSKGYGETLKASELDTKLSILNNQNVVPDNAKALQSLYDRIILRTYKIKKVNGVATLEGKLKDEDLKSLENIYRQMKSKQRLEQGLFFLDPPERLPKQKVSARQLKIWANSKLYFVTIDGKKVSNNKMNSYKADDFSYNQVSKFFKRAIDITGYQYQVDLMTNAYFDNSNQTQGESLGMNDKMTRYSF